MPTGGVSRRGFLGAIAGALVTEALFEKDPERALWVPGAKKIFLPPAPRVVRPLFDLGDVIRFGGDNNCYRVVKLGDPVTHQGTQFVIEGSTPWKEFLESPAHQRWLQLRMRMISEPRPPMWFY